MSDRRWLYVQTIAETGSFSAAAQKLFISQPSLSLYIQKLEKELGCEIFQRRIHPLRLTPAGAVFLETENQILRLRRAAQTRIDDLSGLRHGRVRIGSSHYRSTYLLTRVIPVFRAQYPGIDIVLAEGTTLELEQMALNGETDFSIVLLPLSHSELDYQYLFSEEILLAVSPSHPIVSVRRHCSPGRRYPTVDFAELGGEPFIIMKPGQHLRQSFFRLCEQARITPNILLESQSMMTAEALAAAGIGVTLVPDVMAADPHLPAPPAYFCLSDPPPLRQAVMAYAKNRYLSNAAAALMSVIAACAGRA